MTRWGRGARLELARLRHGRSGLVAGVVVAHRARRSDRRDGMLEHHVVGAGVLDDHGEAIEVLDPPFEVRSIHQADVHRQLFAPRVVQEDVLNVRLRN